MTSKKRIVIVGATSAMAEHCARLWLQEGPAELVLLGRDAARTERVAADLRVRSPGADIQTVLLAEADFLNPAAIRATVDDLWRAGPVDVALIAHGSLPSQEECQNSLGACHSALEVNGVSPVLFAEALVGHMVRAGRGTLGLIGSVAGDRGRKSNYVYGAAKGLVTRYAQGLQHRLAGSAVKVVLIKPGPTDTPMTAHLKSAGARMAPVEGVAQQIVAGMAAGQSVVYAPGKWWLIMMVVRHLPAVVFNRLNI